MQINKFPGDSAYEAAFASSMSRVLKQLWAEAAMSRRLDMFVERYWAEKRDQNPNQLLQWGKKFFSQNDEDGILLEIVRRIGLTRGVFVELGVGNGLENNTMILLMHGWSGLWVGAQDVSFPIPDKSLLAFCRSWITRENCLQLVRRGLEQVGGSRVDVLSIDLDGNDIFILDRLLSQGLQPQVVIVEYNGKFPPPVRWSIEYDPNYEWDETDYQGASLQSFADLLERFGYRLVGCNITGVNAFFVRCDLAEKYFLDIPTAIADLFMPADYNWFVQRGHRTSPRTVARFLISNVAQNCNGGQIINDAGENLCDWSQEDTRGRNAGAGSDARQGQSGTALDQCPG